MTLALIPHAPADPGTFVVWVGAGGYAERPELQWKLDGAVSAPSAIRGLAPVLAGDLAGAEPPIFTGVFSFDVGVSDQPLAIEISSGRERVARTFRPLPPEVPAGVGSSLDVLLLSCFHALEDKTGVAGSVLARHKVQPHLTIFAGDQVYLDLPTLVDFKDDAAWLAAKFQRDYSANWIGEHAAARPDEVPAGCPQMLSRAPNAFMPDDHEFWNNYPFATAPVENSWSPEGRARWTRAARAAYKGFQASCEPNAADGDATRTIVVEPLSILMLDTRSQRAIGSRASDNDLLGPRGRATLARWADDLVARAGSDAPHFGMLVTGQSLMSPKAGDAKGSIADFELPDYAADYAFIVRQLERVSDAGLPTIVATGDVHWGRLAVASKPSGIGSIHEVISSPTSLVSTVFVDQAKDAWGAVRSALGANDPWPRHSDAQRPPPRFGSTGEYDARIAQRGDGKPATMRGNQAFMLRFTRAGGGLDVVIDGIPLSPRDDFVAKQEWSAALKLRAHPGH